MIELAVAEIAQRVRSRKTSAHEVADAFIARIEQLNPKLNALIRFDPDYARANAKAVDARLARGEAMPLAGVPVIIKDNIWVGGRKISQGSKLFEHHVAPADAIAVERLKKAGAVIIGIGACSEFAAKGLTNTPLFGPTRHPMNPEVTPGGSSGGNASAVAAGLAPLALGTDAGGSSRRPPAHTGIVGFKPSLGAIAYGPGFPEPFWSVSVVCPMARSVSDARLMFEAIAGPDLRDPESLPISAPSALNLHDLRIAWSPLLGLDVPIDPEVTAAMEAGLQRLSKAGWRITKADPQWPAGAAEAGLMPLQHAGLAAIHGEAWRKQPELIDPDLAAQIDRGLTLTGAEVAGALETSLQVRRALAAFFADYDLLLCPTSPTVAWSWTELGPKRIGGVEVAPRGHAVFTPLINHAMAPAISIPCGRGRDGLPVGLQIIAPRGADHRVLAAAQAAETTLADMNDYARCTVA